MGSDGPASTTTSAPTTSTTTRNFFELLPLEINIHILSFIGSPSDLYRLIRASRFFFQLFCCDKEKYLSFALRQCFDRANLVVALRILKAGKLLPPWLVPSALRHNPNEEFQTPDGSSRTGWIMEHIFDHGIERNMDLPKDPLARLNVDIEEENSKKKKKMMMMMNGDEIEELWIRLCQLCRLWGIIDYFIRDHSQQVLRQTKRIRLLLVNGTGPIGALSDEAIYKYGLSRVEYDRMQRAFLYFELYRRLLGGQEPCVRPEEPDDEIGYFKLEQIAFGKMLYSHESAELASVYGYLIARMAQIFGCVIAYANARMDVVKKLSPHYNDEGSIAWPGDDDDDNNDNNSDDGEIEKSIKERRLIRRLQLCLDDCKYHLFKQPMYLVGFGLPLCERLFSMPVSKQASIIHRYGHHIKPWLGLDQILMLNRDEAEDDGDYEYDNIENPPRFLGGSTGWKTWHQRCKGDNFNGDISTTECGLSLFGYFFWDDKRFEGLLHDGREEAKAEWPLRVGHLLLNEARLSGFIEFIRNPLGHKGVDPFWLGLGDNAVNENENDETLPAREPGLELLTLAEIEDDDKGTTEEEFNNDDNIDKVLAKANREIKSPMIKDMQLDMTPRWMTELEVYSFDY